jgi:Methyltransferase domain
MVVCAGRARQRDLVRRGYDAISLAYRSDDGEAAASSAEDVIRYAGWVAEPAGLLPPGASVVDLGCGAGIPATRELTGHGLRVVGVDFSAVQLRRAQRLVPAARLVQADMTAFHRDGQAPSDTSVPTCSGITLIPRLTSAGSRRRGSRPIWNRYIPEGDSGHSLHRGHVSAFPRCTVMNNHAALVSQELAETCRNADCARPSAGCERATLVDEAASLDRLWSALGVVRSLSVRRYRGWLRRYSDQLSHLRIRSRNSALPRSL